jgi:hypothetical protein
MGVAKVYRVPKIVVNITSHPDTEDYKFKPLPCAPACNLETKITKGRIFFTMTAVLWFTEVLCNVTPCIYRRFEVSCCVYLESRVTSRRDRKILRMETLTTVLENTEKNIYSATKNKIPEDLILHQS